MSVRLAAPGDAPAIRALIAGLMQGSTATFASGDKPLSEVQEMIATRPAVFVAERDGAVLGYASYTQFRAGNGYTHTMEHSIALAPGAQGRGLGRALMAALEDHARARGAHVMVAGVSAENPAGQAFHAALGYVEAGRMAQVGRKFGRWLDLILMQKIL